MQLPNPDRSLVGGLFATGRILTEGNDTVVVVPTAAVRGSGESAHVWLVENGRAERRDVTLGIRDETVARLLDGDRTVRMTMEQMWKLEDIAKLREEPV